MRHRAVPGTATELSRERPRGGARRSLAGAATEGCVAQTAIDARELSFKVSVLANACATVDERIERVALEYLESVVGARIERL